MADRLDQRKRIIGIDMDDVLIDYATALSIFFNKKFGASVTRDDYVFDSIDKAWKMDVDETQRNVRAFYTSEEHRQAKPVKGAVEAIEKLKAANTLAIITSRPEDVKSLSFEWLNAHFPDVFSDIHFTNHFFLHGDAERSTAWKIRNKSQICKELGVEIFIDDALQNAADVAGAGIPVLLMDSPWNQTDTLPPLVTRVYSWQEIVDKLS